MSKIQEEVKSEKSMRERLQREKDEFMSKNFTLDQELTVCLVAVKLMKYSYCNVHFNNKNGYASNVKAR